MSIHHTFPWSNLKPVVKLQSHLKSRNLCPAYPNTLSLIPSTTITFMFILSTWNMTVKSLLPRWVQRSRFVLISDSLGFWLLMFFYKYLHKKIKNKYIFWLFVSFAISFFFKYCCRPEILLFALNSKIQMRKTLSLWRFVFYICLHFSILKMDLRDIAQLKEFNTL